MKKVFKNQTFDYLDNTWIGIVSDLESSSSSIKRLVKKGVFQPNLCSNFARLETLVETS